MHIGYEHDVDSFVDGTRGMILDRIIGESGLQWDNGAFCLETVAERLPEAVFQFGQALTRIYDLTFLIACVEPGQPWSHTRGRRSTGSAAGAVHTGRRSSSGTQTKPRQGDSHERPTRSNRTQEPTPARPRGI